MLFITLVTSTTVIITFVILFLSYMRRERSRTRIVSETGNIFESFEFGHCWFVNSPEEELLEYHQGTYQTNGKIYITRCATKDARTALARREVYRAQHGFNLILPSFDVVLTILNAALVAYAVLSGRTPLEVIGVLGIVLFLKKTIRTLLVFGIEFTCDKALTVPAEKLAYHQFALEHISPVGYLESELFEYRMQAVSKD